MDGRLKDKQRMAYTAIFCRDSKLIDIDFGIAGELKAIYRSIICFKYLNNATACSFVH